MVFAKKKNNFCSPFQTSCFSVSSATLFGWSKYLHVHFFLGSINNAGSAREGKYLIKYLSIKVANPLKRFVIACESVLLLACFSSQDHSEFPFPPPHRSERTGNRLWSPYKCRPFAAKTSSTSPAIQVLNGLPSSRHPEHSRKNPYSGNQLTRRNGICNCPPRRKGRGSEFLLAHFFPEVPIGKVVDMAVDLEVRPWLFDFIHLVLAAPSTSIQLRHRISGRIVAVAINVIENDSDPEHPASPDLADFVHPDRHPKMYMNLKFLEELSVPPNRRQPGRQPLRNQDLEEMWISFLSSSCLTANSFTAVTRP
jgi:hypothetical protein